MRHWGPLAIALSLSLALSLWPNVSLFLSLWISLFLSLWLFLFGSLSPSLLLSLAGSDVYPAAVQIEHLAHAVEAAPGLTHPSTLTVLILYEERIRSKSFWQ